MRMRFGVLTVSTTCAKNPEKDQAGPTLERAIVDAFPDATIAFKQIVTDEKTEIIIILNDVVAQEICDVFFTVGGTGFAPSDVTPEATREVIEKEAPGLMYALISKSLAVTEMAMLSRLVCGIKNKTIIVNLPGSPKAVLESFQFIKGPLRHAVALVTDNAEAIAAEHVRVQQGSKSKVKIVAATARNRHSIYPMLEAAAAQNLIFKIVSTSDRSIEQLPIQSSLTRVLAEDVAAPHNVPPFPASIKDGYAVRSVDGAGVRSVRSITAAGDAPDRTDLRPGEVARISTGAPLPSGADAVVQVEDTELVEATEDGQEEKNVRILKIPTAGQDIRPIGSDIQEGAIVLQQSKIITPAYIGVMAMLGLPTVKVFKRPSIGVISTGNELIDVRGRLRPGLIYDSNKVTLLALLKRQGYEARDCGIAKDTPDGVKGTLELAFRNNDLIVSSGGVSMSEFDLMKQVLIEDFGATIHFGRLNMKPGKPTVFATLAYDGKKKFVFALPGNPVSCCVTTLLFVIPALRYMENAVESVAWPTIKVILDHDIFNNDVRPEYVRLRVYRDEGDRLRASSTGKQFSSRLNSMVDANALLLIPGETKFEREHIVSACLFEALN